MAHYERLPGTAASRGALRFRICCRIDNERLVCQAKRDRRLQLVPALWREGPPVRYVQGDLGGVMASLDGVEEEAVHRGAVIPSLHDIAKQLPRFSEIP
eukprot:scaffold207_cov409-Prasinococcus_capsulatus_cf.AAC.87